MSQAVKVILSALLLGVLASCETTGDPSRGGLFGWSEGQARQDTSAMQRHLNDVESDNAAQQRKRRALEEEAARKQRELNALQQ